MRAAIVGSGFIARVHAIALQEIGVEVAAVCGRTLEGAQAFGCAPPSRVLMLIGGGAGLVAPSLYLCAGGYLGCAPICLRSVSESKYWRLSLILSPAKVKKMAPGVC